MNCPACHRPLTPLVVLTRAVQVAGFVAKVVRPAPQTPAERSRFNLDMLKMHNRNVNRQQKHPLGHQCLICGTWDR